ncbi:MAG: hypothetical protein CVU05_03210 [Bacteroidetes bacterium HGW-Bacteroidetes-21]|jgi:PAS domain S-box-containing protein|nr:MAG: hypothetical protein CVU05_03210 [Bacteroidetes bacterium HGW-Bacteroidetes-21]
MDAIKMLNDEIFVDYQQISLMNKLNEEYTNGSSIDKLINQFVEGIIKIHDLTFADIYTPIIKTPSYLYREILKISDLDNKIDLLNSSLINSENESSKSIYKGKDLKVLTSKSQIIDFFSDFVRIGQTDFTGIIKNNLTNLNISFIVLFPIVVDNEIIGHLIYGSSHKLLPQTLAFLQKNSNSLSILFQRVQNEQDHKIKNEYQKNNANKYNRLFKINSLFGFSEDAPNEDIDNIMLQLNEICQNDIVGYYRSLLFEKVNQFSFPIIIANSNGIIVFVNTKYTEFTGFSTQELFGKDLRQLDFYLSNEQYFLRILSEINIKGFWTGEVKNKKKNSDYYYEKIVLSGIRNSEGDVQNYILIVEDVTIRKSVEKLMLLNEQILHNTDSGFFESVFILEQSGKINVAVGKVHSLFSCESSEIIGKNFREIFSNYPEILPLIDSTQNGLINETHIRIGEQVFEFKISPIYEHKLQISGILIVSRDVTLRIKEEARLNLMQFVIEHSSDEVLIASSDGRFFDINISACNMLGFSREELLSMYVTDIDIVLNAEKWKAHFEKLKEVGTIKTESIQKKKDGTLINVEIVANYVVFDNQELNCAFIRDISDRKVAEKSMLLNKYAFDHVSETLLFVKSNSIIVDANIAACKMLGYSFEELINVSVTDVLLFFKMELWEHLFNSIRESGNYSFETYIRTKMGLSVPVEVVMNYIKYADQEINCVFIRDISDRKQTEMLILRSEKRYKALTQSALDAIVTVDSFGHIVDWNSAAERIFGYSKDDVLDEKYSLSNIIPQYINNSQGDIINRILSSDRLNSADDFIEYKGVHKSGYYFDIEFSFSKWEVFEGVFFSGIIRDITKRKLSIAMLRESEAKYRSIFNDSNDAIMLMSQEMKYMAGNPASINLFALDNERALLNYTFSDLSPEYQAGSVSSETLAKQMVKEALENKSVSFEWIHKKSDGTIFPTSIMLSRIVLNGVVCLHAIVRDFTVFKTLSTELLHTKVLLEETNQVARVGGWEYDLNSHKVTWSSITKDIHEAPQDYEPDEISMIKFYDKKCDIHKVNEAFEKCRLNGTPWEIQIEILTLKGNRKWVSMMGKAEMVNGKCERMYGVFQDIDEKIKAQQKMERYKRLTQKKTALLDKEIKRSLVLGQEKERKRISREIHDGLCQILSVIEMSFSEMKLKNKVSKIDIAKASDLLKVSLNEAIRISNNLSPSVLVDYGLVSGLKKLVKLNSSQSPINIILRTNNCNDRLPGDVELTFYRIAQEALRNSLTHAECNTVYVLFFCSETSINLRIIDNGKGIDETLLKSHSGFGLKNIFERANLIGAKVRISSKKNKFTSVSIKL